MRTAPINIGRCARFLYDDEEENVWKGKKGKILPRTEKEICRGQCLGRNVGRWYNFMMSLCGGMRASRPTDMIYGTLCNKDGGRTICAPYGLYKRKS